MSTNYPTISCEIAFASTPLAATQVYSDVSERLRGQITIRRGRPDELDSIETGVATLTLDNRDGALNPFNVASPFYPNVVPRRRLRLKAILPAIANGQQIVALNGATGVFHLAAGGQQTAMLSSAASASEVQAALEALSTIGAGNVSVSGNDGGPWTATFGVAFFGQVAPLISVLPTLTSAGTPSVTTTTPGGNKVYLVSDGTASSGLFFMDVSAPSGSFSGSQFATATVAAMQNTFNTFLGVGNSLVTGFTGGPWTIEFTGANGNSSVPTISVSNISLSPLSSGFPYAVPTGISEVQQLNLATPSAGVWRASFDGVETGYLAWNASASTVQAALEALSTIGAGNVSVTGSAGGPYTVTFAGALIGGDRTPIVLVVGLSGGSPSVAVSTATISFPLFQGFIEDWPPEEPDGTIGDATVTITASDAFMLFARKRINGTLGAAIPTVATTTLGGGGANEVQTLKLNGAVSGNYRLRFTHLSNSATTPSLAWNASAAAVQTALRALSSIGGANVNVTGGAGTYTITFVGALANTDVGLIIADHSFPGQRSDLMVAQILDALGWPAADRDLEVGRSVLADAELDDQPVLSLLQLIAASENGVIFIGPDGKVVYQNRHRRTRQGAPLATLGSPAQGDELPVVQLTPSFDDTWLYNEVAVSAEGGDPQIARDTASENTYFTSTLSRQTLIATDSEALSAAQYLLARYGVPGARIPEAVLRGVLDPTRLWPQLLGREIGDRVRAIKRLRGGGEIAQDVYIEAITHVIARDERTGARDWVTTWQLSPAATSGFWILGDSTWGVLGTTTRLAY